MGDEGLSVLNSVKDREVYCDLKCKVLRKVIIQGTMTSPEKQNKAAPVSKHEEIETYTFHDI